MLEEVYRTYIYGDKGVAVFVYPDPKVTNDIVPALAKRGGRVMHLNPGDILQLPDLNIDIRYWTVAVDRLSVPVTLALRAYISKSCGMEFEEYLNRMFSDNCTVRGAHYTDPDNVRPSWYDIDNEEDPPN